VTAELVLDRRGPSLVMRLNRPEARNALTPGLIAGIGTAVAEAEADPAIRALILTGTGDRAFCAGMDLRAFADGARFPDAQSPGADAYRRLMRGEAGVPVIGAANGTAVGGGFELLLVANEYQVKVPVPFVPGSEFAGVVAEAAGGVSHLAAGDRVFGTAMVGAFGEEIAVTAHSVRRIPDGVEDVAAAAFGVAHRTAYHVLKSVAAVQPGEELVVLGAGGGVGLAAVQLGSVLGATVTAVASFVTVGYASGAIPRIPLNLVLLKGVHVVGFQFRDFATHAPDELRRNEQELLELLAAQRARPHIGATFGLTEAAAALRHVADGKAIGKVVLDVRRVPSG
jgi:NADPH2:quinone reductase